eukprot:3494923-Alexandrium_andersonii.AAC.1
MQQPLRCLKNRYCPACGLIDAPPIKNHGHNIGIVKILMDSTSPHPPPIPVSTRTRRTLILHCSDDHTNRKASRRMTAPP